MKSHFTPTLVPLTPSQRWAVRRFYEAARELPKGWIVRVTREDDYETIDVYTPGPVGAMVAQIVRKP